MILRELITKYVIFNIFYLQWHDWDHIYKTQMTTLTPLIL